MNDQVKIRQTKMRYGEQLHAPPSILGPIVNRYLMRLDAAMAYLDDGDTSFVFVSRAGVRILDLLTEYRRARGLGSPKGQVGWLSRISICKGTFTRTPAAEAALASEFAGRPLSDLLKAVLRHHPELFMKLQTRGVPSSVPAEIFQEWMSQSSPQSELVRDYIDECGRGLSGYLSALVGSSKRVVIVDSGWNGSSQQLLSLAFPKLAWKGLYFGRIRSRPDENDYDPVVGLTFEAERYDPANPETSFVLHRHLIESLFESPGQSIEEIPHGRYLEKAEALISSHFIEISDPNYEAIIAYLREAPTSAADIESRYASAMDALASKLATPTRDDVPVWQGKDRSADFGRSVVVPTVLDPVKEKELTTEQRIERALWKQGQIALEYSPAIARRRQLESLGLAATEDYFDPRGKREEGSSNIDKGTVAVVTRTKDRPLLLGRAAQSVASQSYDDYKWIVVNDGGDPVSVEEALEESIVDRRRLSLINNDASLGMEAASNRGIRSIESDFIAIHDDDDSWEPEFLARTVGFLKSAAGSRYGGVITHSTQVFEEIEGSTIRTTKRQPYQEWVRNIQLAEMMSQNLFAPIAFVYRRELYDRIGGYDEELPVLGDWAFNIKFLLEADIAVIPTPLANYHHRDSTSASTSYSNSVTGGWGKHEEFASVMRNRLFRTLGPAAATALMVGYGVSAVRAEIEKASQNSDQRATSKLDQGSKDDLNDYLWIVSQLTSWAYGKNEPRAIALVHELIEREDWDRASRLLSYARLAIRAPKNFDSEQYLRRYPDVAEEVRQGNIASAFFHYVAHGRKERRRRPSKAEVKQ